MGKWEKIVKQDIDKLSEFLNEQYPGYSLSRDGNNKLMFLEIESITDKDMHILLEKLKKNFPQAFD